MHDVVAHAQLLEVAHADVELGERPVREPALRVLALPGPASVATAMKWYGVVADDSKYKPSMDAIRPSVQ